MKKRSELAPYPALDDKASIDVEEARRALEKVQGNISAAAKLMNVDSARLRAFVAAEPVLRRMQEEILERGVDRAIEILFEGMKDEHYGVRLQASKELLRTRVASVRGFGPQAAAIDLPTPGQTITIKWLGDEDDEPKDDPKLIEGEKVRH
jgi:hypothetical protein